MKKLITLLFILSLAYFSLEAQVMEVTVAKETFGNLVFGTNQHGPGIAIDGIFYSNSTGNFICGDDTTAITYGMELICGVDTVIGIPGAPYDTIGQVGGDDLGGYPRHFDYDVVQAATDAGLGGFTSQNGHIISGSSDNSIQMNTYVGSDAQTWDNPSRGVKLHMTPSGAYAGSWDSIIYSDIDLTRFEGTLDSLSVNFGFQKRAGASWTWSDTIRGIGVEVSLDGGAWIELDTMVVPNPLADVWEYLEMKVPTENDISGVATVDILIRAYRNQFAIDDLSLVGWGVDLPVLTDIDIISASTIINTAGGTLALGTDVTPKTVYDTTVIWSIGAASNGCASIDEDGVLTAEGNGTVVVTATANDGGGAIATLDVTITNNPRDVEAITVTSSGATLGGGSTMQMSATVLPVCADDKTFTWSVNDEDIATISTEGLLTPVASGSVIVTATAADGSDVTGTKTILISVTGIQSIENTEISIYPVPAQGTLHIDNVSDISMIEVLGITGSVVSRVSNDANDNILLDVTNLHSGMYFIKLQSVDGNQYITKFIKE